MSLLFSLFFFLLFLYCSFFLGGGGGGCLYRCNFFSARDSLPFPDTQVDLVGRPITNYQFRSSLPTESLETARNLATYSTLYLKYHLPCTKKSINVPAWVSFLRDKILEFDSSRFYDEVARKYAFGSTLMSCVEQSSCECCSRLSNNNNNYNHHHRHHHLLSCVVAVLVMAISRDSYYYYYYYYYYV